MAAVFWNQRPRRGLRSLRSAGPLGHGHGPSRGPAGTGRGRPGRPSGRHQSNVGRHERREHQQEGHGHHQQLQAAEMPQHRQHEPLRQGDAVRRSWPARHPGRRDREGAREGTSWWRQASGLSKPGRRAPPTQALAATGHCDTLKWA